MFALGAQQARQPVPLLLRATPRKDGVQVAIAAQFRSPDHAKVLDDLAYIGLYPVLLVEVP